jgi:N-acetylglutamate synthase-like GNAT family acetyltransferase
MEITRIDGNFSRWDELLALILSSFAYMDGVIDPPSSAHKLTLASLAQKAKDEIGFIATHEGKIAGCMFLKPEEKCLYVGKLAVAPGVQGKGLGRKLLDVAEEIAKAMQLPALRLETRIELIGNQTTFSRWGFFKSAEGSHYGFTRKTFVEMRKEMI